MEDFSPKAPDSATEHFRSLPDITVLVEAAKNDPLAWRRLGEDSYRLVVKRMQNWLTASGFTNKNLDIDTLFADVWCKRMQTAVRSIAFSDRWHFLKVFCQNVKWEAYDNAKKAMEDPVLPSPEEHSRNETDPARLVEIAEDAESLERLIQQLHVAIGDLPTDCRTAIEYHFFDDKTFRQIGSELNLSWSAVKKRVDKASALLQSTLSSSS